MIPVAVIGAGLAGLATAKAALEYGLTPTVFESASQPGGLWRPDDGFVWPGLTTNISRFTCSFSDFPWPAGAPDFPTSATVADYLTAYREEFGLAGSIRLGCRVERVEPDAGTWLVTVTSDGARTAERFDTVIIATGFFARPVAPHVPGVFAGRQMHSGEYRGPEQFRDSRVAVVGLAFSGSEIAAEIAHTGTPVTAVTPRGFWILPKSVPVDGSGRSVPLDLYHATRTDRLSGPPVEQHLRHQARNRTLSALGHNPGRLDAALALGPDSTDPPHLVVSDTLLTAVDTGRLAVLGGRVSGLETSAVVLEDGRRVAADVIVWCTGYRPDVSFLHPGVLDALEYDPTDMLAPLVAAGSVFPRGGRAGPRARRHVPGTVLWCCGTSGPMGLRRDGGRRPPAYRRRPRGGR